MTLVFLILNKKLMEEMNNVSQQPPTPTSIPPIPPTPSIPAAHQMMGSMPVATTTASGGGMIANIAAVLILIVGGGSLYFALNKNSSPQKGTPVNEINGFTLNNEDSVDQVSETTTSEVTQINEPTETNATANSITGTDATSTTSTTSGTNYKFTFACKDLFGSGDFQKITGSTGAIEVNETMLPNKDVPGGFTLMCSFTQRQKYLTSLFTFGVNFSSASSFANMKTVLEKYSGETFTSIQNIGSEAFSSNCCGDHVFASNKKYFFSPIGSNFFAEANATKERTALEALLLLNVQAASKIVDSNLNKF